MSVEIRIPIRVSNPNNGSHGHWAIQAKKRRAERGTCLLALRQHKPPKLPCVVTIIRVAPRKLDVDAVGAACKSVKDEVAAWLGLPCNKRGHAEDADHRVHWRMQQGSDGRNYAVVVQAETVGQEMVDHLNAGLEWSPCA